MVVTGLGLLMGARSDAGTVRSGADQAAVEGVWIVPTGGDPQNPQEVDRLRLATPTGSDIVKGLDGVFRVRDGGILPDDPEARLITRSIEGSNVAATTALVEMIEASRSWDTQIKMISDVRDMDSATANLMQLPR